MGHESRLRHCAVGSERQLVGRVVGEGRTHVIGLADTVSDVTDLQFSLVDISGFRFEAFLSRIALAAHAQLVFPPTHPGICAYRVPWHLY